MSLMDWMGESIRDARQKNDRERLWLASVYGVAYQYRETNPDQALNLFAEAKQLADRLGEPWWALFYEHCKAHALLHFKRDYRNVLDVAVQNALAVRKPPNDQFPGRFSIFDDLIAAYLGIDAEGYAEQIQQALDYLDKEIPQEPNSDRYLMRARQRIFAMECDKPDAAHDVAMRELAMADADDDRERADHFRVFIYCRLCQVAWKRRDFEALREWSETGESVTRKVGHQVELAELLVWKGVAARQAGEDEKSKQYCRAAVARQERQKMPPTEGYWDGLCAWHELKGDYDKALKVRQREYKVIAGWGRLLPECRALVECCRCLARMGQPLEPTLTQAREAAGKLKRPEKYLKELDQLAAGGRGAGERGA